MVKDPNSALSFNIKMSGLLPAAVYGLEVPCGDVMIPAVWKKPDRNSRDVADNLFAIAPGLSSCGMSHCPLKTRNYGERT